MQDSMNTKANPTVRSRRMTKETEHRISSAYCINYDHMLTSIKSVFGDGLVDSIYKDNEVDDVCFILDSIINRLDASAIHGDEFILVSESFTEGALSTDGSLELDGTPEYRTAFCVNGAEVDVDEDDSLLTCRGHNNIFWVLDAFARSVFHNMDDNGSGSGVELPINYTGACITVGFDNRFYVDKAGSFLVEQIAIFIKRTN